MPVTFEWDDDKAKTNLKNIESASTRPVPSLAIPSRRFSPTMGTRAKKSGRSSSGIRSIRRLMLVSFTERGHQVVASSVHGLPLGTSEKLMKKTKVSEVSPAASDELRSEYQFDYRNARPNRFADRAARSYLRRA